MSGSSLDELERPPWRCWTSALSGLGECPIWDSRGQALFWIDVYGPTLHRVAGPDRSAETWALPDMPGSFALTSVPGRLLLALHSGLAVLELGNGAVAPFAGAPYDVAKFRFNDGRCDRRGRFWVGTNRQPQSGEPRGSAGYYRVDGADLQRALGGATIANGLAFSPDDRTMYVSDGVNHRLLAYDYDLATGHAGNERTFAQLDPRLVPDGAAVDTEGGYWSAMYGAGVIMRFAPDGRLDRVLAAPVMYPTMVAFGGPALSTMFVTTARRFAAPELLAQQPLSGAVFAADVDVIGFPEPRFAYPDR